MSYRIITKIACRLLALYTFVQSMCLIPASLVTIFTYRSQINDFTQTIASIFSTGTFMLLMAILLWVFADRIAKIIIKDVTENNVHKEIDYSKIMAMVFSVIGIVVLVGAIPNLIKTIIQNNIVSSMNISFKETNMYAEYLSRIIGESVKVILGLWLLVGAKGIVKFVKIFRDYGLDRIEDVKK